MNQFAFVAFRSRTETLEFLDILRRSGISCQATNTPKEAGVGCGLSAKITVNVLPVAKRLLSRYNFKTFAGIFSVTTKYGKSVVRAV